MLEESGTLDIENGKDYECMEVDDGVVRGGGTGPAAAE